MDIKQIRVTYAEMNLTQKRRVESAFRVIEQCGGEWLVSEARQIKKVLQDDLYERCTGYQK